MLRILYVIDQKPDSYPGGIEYHLLDLINGCMGRDLPAYMMFPERDSICLRYYRDYSILESRYGGRQLSDHRLRDPENEAAFNDILDNINVEIVHFQSIRTLPISLIELAKERKKKIVMTLHEYYFWCINCIMLAPDFCWFERNEETCFNCLSTSNYAVSREYIRERRQYLNYLFSLIDMVIVPSVYVKEACTTLHDRLSEKRCVIIENGIDNDLLKAAPSNGRNFLDGKLSMAFLGNFLHYKGNKAFLELVEHYKDSDTVSFSIVGNIFDASLIPSCTNLKALGGYKRDKVVESIRLADPDFVLLLSNWPETFSYTLSEAIASATPVIATDGGALRERVSRERAGFLVPMEDPLPRTIEIIEDVRQNPGVLHYFRERVYEARKRLKTVDDMIEDHLRLYKSLARKAD